MAFTVLAAVSQLERELIIERVKVGLANARAKGKIIGRKKLRNSDLNRALRRKGLTYRAIADLCGCSHGSVYAEVLAMKKEDELKQNQLIEESLKKQAEEQAAKNLSNSATENLSNNSDDLPNYT